MRWFLQWNHICASTIAVTWWPDDPVVRVYQCMIDHGDRAGLILAQVIFWYLIFRHTWLSYDKLRVYQPQFIIFFILLNLYLYVYCVIFSAAVPVRFLWRYSVTWSWPLDVNDVTSFQPLNITSSQHLDVHNVTTSWHLDVNNQCPPQGHF